MNFVLNVGHLWDGGSQWCNRLLRGPMGPQWPVLSWGKGEREGEGGYGTRLAREETKQRWGPDACFAPGKAYTQGAQPTQTLVFPSLIEVGLGVGKGGHYGRSKAGRRGPPIERGRPHRGRSHHAPRIRYLPRAPRADDVHGRC